jgi:hypothetical protein
MFSSLIEIFSFRKSACTRIPAAFQRFLLNLRHAKRPDFRSHSHGTTTARDQPKRQRPLIIFFNQDADKGTPNGAHNRAITALPVIAWSWFRLPYSRTQTFRHIKVNLVIARIYPLPIPRHL